MVSEPFLSRGDHFRKGGFATLPNRQPITRGIANEILRESSSKPGKLGRKTGCELGNTQKLGVLPNQIKQAILVKNSRTGPGLDFIHMLRLTIFKILEIAFLLVLASAIGHTRCRWRRVDVAFPLIEVNRFATGVLHNVLCATWLCRLLSGQQIGNPPRFGFRMERHGCKP